MIYESTRLNLVFRVTLYGLDLYFVRFRLVFCSIQTCILNVKIGRNLFAAFYTLVKHLPLSLSFSNFLPFVFLCVCVPSFTLFMICSFIFSTPFFPPYFVYYIPSFSSCNVFFSLLFVICLIIPFFVYSLSVLLYPCLFSLLPLFLLLLCSPFQYIPIIFMYLLIFFI